MNFLDLYYLVKPAIPHHLRLKLRRHVALRQRRRHSDVWPIRETAAVPPAAWAGWPDGKDFAFVLTHDVEGEKGMNSCRALAEMEMQMGFRSSFNFVPEGSYEVASSVRSFLRQNGFEVGVHDLHHDGSLYRSRAAFEAAASRINDHLERWEATGFRSAFMFHNLDWLKDLNILYDASTFDTDPFEPQPDGVNTIFPFRVQRADGSSYVELPYTLPQDSTLFLILGEKDNGIWKRKLDWVAQHGGMALVNVHPDYIGWKDSLRHAEFPVALYQDFLEYAATRFGDQAWFTLPGEVARFVQRSARLELDNARDEIVAAQGAVV